MLGRMFKGGRQLSGGQWQRLALARLYFRDASVLIFDEPTAALDANAEFEVIETLRKNALGRITVLISHRFRRCGWRTKLSCLRGRHYRIRLARGAVRRKRDLRGAVQTSGAGVRGEC